MRLSDQSAEYYRLREGHERALALGARTGEQRLEHLLAAERYAALAQNLTKAQLPDVENRRRLHG
jgi:hypothetical protein